MAFKEMMKKAAEAAAKGGDFTELPPGKYVMKLTDAFRNKSQKGEGRNQTNLDWEVTEPGDMAGETHRMYHNLDHEVGLQICVADFLKMGFDLSSCNSLEDIDQYIEQVKELAPVFEVTLVKKGQYLNTRLGAFLGSGAPPKEESAAPEVKPEAEAVPDEASVSLTIGNKVKYTFKGKAYIMPIKVVNSAAETIDTAMHKGIPLTDILELIE